MNPFTNLWSVKLGDWGRALIIAIITAPLTIILQSVNAGSLVINWKTVLAAALSGGIAYILKNLGTGAGGNLLSNK